MHINVKPLTRGAVYETPEQAINHVFVYDKWAKDWDQDGQPFGRVVDLWRSINDAIKARDFSRFSAHKRRGYWRVEYVGPVLTR